MKLKPLTSEWGFLFNSFYLSVTLLDTKFTNREFLLGTPRFVSIERCSFDCWKTKCVCISTLQDWLEMVFFIQSLLQQVKAKPIVTDLHIFFRRCGSATYIYISFGIWLIRISASFVICLSDFFGFGFTALSWKPLYFTRAYHCTSRWRRMYS